MRPGVHLGALQQAGLAERARGGRLERQRALRAHAQRARAVRLGRQVVHEHHMVVALQQPVAAPLRAPGFRVRVRGSPLAGDAAPDARSRTSAAQQGSRGRLSSHSQTLWAPANSADSIAIRCSA